MANNAQDCVVSGGSRNEIQKAVSKKHSWGGTASQMPEGIFIFTGFSW